MVALKCPSCNADIELDDKRDVGFCCYCGTKVLIRTPLAQVDGISTVENLLVRADEYYKQNDISKAKEYYNRVLDIDANNTRAKEQLNFLKNCADPFREGEISEATVVAVSQFDATIKFSNGDTAKVHISNLASDTRNVKGAFDLVKINEKLTVINKGLDKMGRPFFRVKSVDEEKKKLSQIPFAEQLKLREQEQQRTELQRKAIQEEHMSNNVVGSIKRVCSEQQRYGKEHVIQGYYRRYNDDGYEMVGEFVGEDKIYPNVRGRGYKGGCFGDIVDVSNCNITLLVQLINKKVNELGFSAYTLEIQDLPEKEIKSGFLGDKLKATGKVKKAIYFSMRW